MPITIRRATREDIPWLLGELKKFAQFYGTKHTLFGDETYSTTALTVMIEDHFCLVAETKDQPVGFIAGFEGFHPYNPKVKTLTEAFWWVSEEHRNTRAGLSLLNEFCEYGKANFNWVLFTLEHHSPVKDACLLKRGFHLSERSYLMEVE